MEIIDAIHTALKRHEIDLIAVESLRDRQTDCSTVLAKMPSIAKDLVNFKTQQLLNVFGGWYTLSYLFSIPSGDKNRDGSECMKDYLVCSRDVSEIDTEHRPEINPTIKRIFNKDVYGFAIIAPSSMFGRI